VKGEHPVWIPVEHQAVADRPGGVPVNLPVGGIRLHGVAVDAGDALGEPVSAAGAAMNHPHVLVGVVAQHVGDLVLVGPVA
jgi:hypothetical protein